MIISRNAEETIGLAAQVAAAASAGEVYALVGPLGAGKTQFVKGFVRGMGSDAVVTSPTFVLAHEYEGGRLPVFHFDFYRLEAAEAVLRMGFDDYLSAHGVCLVEWADRFPALLPANAITITFVHMSENQRALHGIPGR